MSVSEVVKLIVSASPLELLAGFIVAGMFGYVVYGWQYKAVVKDRDDWKTIAMESTKQNGQLLDVLESGKRGDSRR